MNVGIPTLRTGQGHPHPEPIGGGSSPVELMPGYRVVLLDQRKLPSQERFEFFARADEAVRRSEKPTSPARFKTAPFRSFQIR